MAKFKKINPKTNTIYRGDNLEIMKAMPDGFVDLCYIDPPFFTQRDYKNIWGDRESVMDWPISSCGAGQFLRSEPPERQRRDV